MIKKISIIATVVLMSFFSGCSGDRYATNQSTVGNVSQVYYGQVISIRDVEIGDNGSGALLGAVIGGLAGSQFGQGNGRLGMTGVGAVAGAMAGNNINKDIGQEIAIKLEDGREIFFTNKVDNQAPQSFRTGDYVRVYYRGGKVSKVELDNNPRYEQKREIVREEPQYKDDTYRYEKYEKPETKNGVILQKDSTVLSDDKIRRLRELSELKKEGILTDKEVEAEKKKILGN